MAYKKKGKSAEDYRSMQEKLRREIKEREKKLSEYTALMKEAEERERLERISEATKAFEAACAKAKVPILWNAEIAVKAAEAYIAKYGDEDVSAPEVEAENGDVEAETK